MRNYTNNINHIHTLPTDTDRHGSGSRKKKDKPNVRCLLALGEGASGTKRATITKEKHHAQLGAARTVPFRGGGEKDVGCYAVVVCANLTGAN